MKKISLTLIASVFLMYACKKNDDGPSTLGPEPEITINEFFPMNIGNYWVYEFVQKTPNGDIIGNPSYDTLKIVSDTVINNHTYFLFNTDKPMNGTQYLRRDSLGYIVDIKGDLKLLPSANEGIYNFDYFFLNGDTAYSYWEEYIDDFQTDTEIGNFVSLGQLAKHQAWPSIGGNFTVDSNLYAEIGMIQRSFSFSSGGKLIGSIIDYHLEE